MNLINDTFCSSRVSGLSDDGLQRGSSSRCAPPMRSLGESSMSGSSSARRGRRRRIQWHRDSAPLCRGKRPFSGLYRGLLGRRCRPASARKPHPGSEEIFATAPISEAWRTAPSIWRAPDCSTTISARFIGKASRPFSRPFRISGWCRDIYVDRPDALYLRRRNRRLRHDARVIGHITATSSRGRWPNGSSMTASSASTDRERLAIAPAHRHPRRSRARCGGPDGKSGMKKMGRDHGLARRLGVSMGRLERALQGRVRSGTCRCTTAHDAMERARDLLEHSKMSVREVGLACGYASFSSFVRAFRAVHGKTPGRLRATDGTLFDKAAHFPGL